MLPAWMGRRAGTRAGTAGAHAHLLRAWRQSDTIKSPAMAFVAGAAPGLLIVAPSVPDRIEFAADAIDCKPASTVQRDVECDQVKAPMRMLPVGMPLLFPGEAFSYAARRYERRKRGAGDGRGRRAGEGAARGGPYAPQSRCSRRMPAMLDMARGAGRRCCAAGRPSGR